ncbi:hypothetical protein FRB97_009612 [Tulasnella sp. 331]|nr:hypothetical protein FRB97_009612 [Tulasnella sp. 331]
MNCTGHQHTLSPGDALCSLTDSPIPIDHAPNLTNHTAAAVVDDTTTSTHALSQIMTTFAPIMSNGYLQNSVNFFFFGTILESGRQLWQWVMDRFTEGFVLTAIFDSTDPAYEWFFSYLNDEKIWSTTREVHVSAKTNSRSWGFKSGKDDDDDGSCAQYLPTYDKPQLFRFKSTWCQVVRKKSGSTHTYDHEFGGQLILTLYTRQRSVLDDLIQTSREKHMKKAKSSRLVVHGSCPCGFFCQTTTKARRGLDSLILPVGVKETLVNDARDFLRSEAWYSEAGIQHKRGYLLYGPPGTGKSSTVHALAGELDLEIYTLSLATNGLDDAGLGRLIASTPAHSIILIEDIDCAFPSREEKERKKEAAEKGVIIAETRSTITLSGLLNVIDGCSSEEGRLLFATTNYVDRLDPALLRAGRMDVKIHYKMSTRDQIINLFKRFYPCSPESALQLETMAQLENLDTEDENTSISACDPLIVCDLALTPPSTPLQSPSPTLPPTTPPRSDSPMPDDPVIDDSTPIYPPRLPSAEVDALATRFADVIPPNQYTVAELQGYLLTLKTRPYDAVNGVHRWMEEMEEERERLKKTEEEAAKEKLEMEKLGITAPPPRPLPTFMPSPPFMPVSLPSPGTFSPPLPFLPPPVTGLRGLSLRGSWNSRGRGRMM